MSALIEFQWWLQDNVDGESQLHFDNEGEVLSSHVLDEFDELVESVVAAEACLDNLVAIHGSEMHDGDHWHEATEALLALRRSMAKLQRDNSSGIKERLEYLRGELEAERISYGELYELQCLREFIDPGDVQLLEAAGVPEFPEEKL